MKDIGRYRVPQWLTIVIVIQVLTIIAIVLTAGIVKELQVRQNQQELCESYCNCLETQDCPYTFDYKDVKDCDCGGKE